MSDKANPPPEGSSRREVLQAAVGLTVVGGVAAGTWGVLELLHSQGPVDSWHKSVCRYCGTGCGIQVGLKRGKIASIRGDEAAHNRGVICIKGATLAELPSLPGRLTEPLVRSQPGDKDSPFRKASWDEGQVSAVLIMGTNPAQSLPDAGKYRQALRKCFVAVAEIVPDSETAKLADVLLPAALWVEKEGVYGQTERRYQLIEKLLDPPGECRSDLQILVDLAQRLGAPHAGPANTGQP